MLYNFAQNIPSSTTNTIWILEAFYIMTEWWKYLFLKCIWIQNTLTILNKSCACYIICTKYSFNYKQILGLDLYTHHMYARTSVHVIAHKTERLLSVICTCFNLLMSCLTLSYSFWASCSFLVSKWSRSLSGLLATPNLMPQLVPVAWSEESRDFRRLFSVFRIFIIWWSCSRESCQWHKANKLSELSKVNSAALQQML